MRGLVLLMVLLLAGCAGPTPPAAPTVVEPEVAPPVYTLGVRVLEERADGTPLPGAGVQAVELDAAGKATGPLMSEVTDADGWARFSWNRPMKVAILAVAASGAEWTVEGAHLEVGDVVVADQALVVSDRDVFIPLYHARLDFTTALTWSTVVAGLGPDGMIEPKHTGVAIPLADDLRAAYFTRLAAARIDFSWNDSPTSHADIAVGLAWDGMVWVEGKPMSTNPVPGPRAASFSDNLPDGRPADLSAAQLEAVAITRSAVIGDVPFAIVGELRFGDHYPGELPAPRCGHMTSQLELPCLELPIIGRP